jgi:hypothetical protein
VDQIQLVSTHLNHPMLLRYCTLSLLLLVQVKYLRTMDRRQEGVMAGVGDTEEVAEEVGGHNWWWTGRGPLGDISVPACLNQRKQRALLLQMLLSLSPVNPLPLGLDLHLHEISLVHVGYPNPKHQI